MGNSAGDSGQGLDLSRRQFLTLAGSAAAVPLLGSSLIGAVEAQAQEASAPVRGPARGRHNILFVFTDQERYFQRWPDGLTLPGHERLKRTGVTFTNHYCPAAMCTSSRSVLLTGLQTPDTGMFDNADLPFQKPLSTDIPTIGHMLRKAGYYAAYKGKWHLNHDFDTSQPDHLFTKEMEPYGFSDFVCPGDVVGHTLGGYEFDQLIGGSAIAWLRRRGRPLSDEGNPWALFVSLVNPHDIMYFNTDAPGQQVQDTGRLLMHAARTPEHEFFRKSWDVPLPGSLTQPVGAPGRPGAHAEYLKTWGYVLGEIPPEEVRWRRFTDFYINSIRLADLQIAGILAELDALGLAENTIVVFTADHGEMGGAHGLRGKGPFAYQEAIHLPFYVVHPDVKGNQECRALTGHIDMVPTLLAMAGVGSGRIGELAGRELAGKDITSLLSDPGRADLHALRDAVLYTYSSLSTNDSDFGRILAEAKATRRDPKEVMRASGYKPDLKKRGSVRTVFDGRYKFCRYFAPTERNRPQSIGDIYQRNDAELFDLEKDPSEMTNLAADRNANADLVLAMSGKLEAIIKAEIGVDDGREMPKAEGVDWSVDRMDL